MKREQGPLPAVVCSGCQIKRTPHEFAGYKTCSTCRGRNKKRRPKDAVNPATLAYWQQRSSIFQ